jgi:hypothetical protein
MYEVPAMWPGASMKVPRSANEDRPPPFPGGRHREDRIDAGAAGVSENRDSAMVPEGGNFQQAETAPPEPPSLQIVAKAKTRRREAAKPSKGQPKLTRVAFRVSRLMEFCTRRELQNQTGHAMLDWALVVLKELVDNALDALRGS